MKAPRPVVSSVVLFGLGIALVTGCAGGSKRADSGDLGDSQVREGKTSIPLEEKVVVTKSREVPTISTTRRRADLNRVKEDDLVALGLSEEIAENVVEYRDDNGPFRSLNELSKVEGFSPQMMQWARERLGVSPSASQQPSG